jgi:hypothetical protein
VEAGSAVDLSDSDSVRQMVETQVRDSIGVPVSVELVASGTFDRSATKTDVTLHEYAR